MNPRSSRVFRKSAFDPVDAIGVILISLATWFLLPHVSLLIAGFDPFLKIFEFIAVMIGVFLFWG